MPVLLLISFALSAQADPRIDDIISRLGWLSGNDVHFQAPSPCEVKSVDQFCPQVKLASQVEHERTHKILDSNLPGNTSAPIAEQVEFWNQLLNVLDQTREQKMNQFFKSAHEKPALVRLCCGTNTSCVQEFQKTAFMLDESGGDYLEDENAVRVSAGLDSYVEKAQWFVVHELGHACAHAILKSRNSALPMSQNPIMSDLLSEKFGHDFFNCVTNELKANDQLDTVGYSEAFAEAFAQQFLPTALQNESCGAFGGYKAASVCRYANNVESRLWCKPENFIFNQQ